MDKEQRDWITEAIDMSVRATEKKVLITLMLDNSDDDGTRVVITNATTPEQICWLARTMNGEEPRSGESGDGEDN